MSSVHSSTIKTQNRLNIWNGTADAAQRAKDVARDHPGACTFDSVASVILGVAAAETFINETGDLARHSASSWSNGSPWRELREVCTAPEHDRSGPVRKYLRVSVRLAGTTLVRDAEPVLSFDRLVRLRNSWVHGRAQAAPPELFEWFVDPRWTYNRPEDHPKLSGWLLQLETPHVATWACRSAYNVIWHIVEQITATGEADHHKRVFSFQWEGTDNDSRCTMPSA